MAPSPLINNLVQRVESSALTLHLAALPGQRHRLSNPAAVRDSLIYMRDTLRGYGWLVVDQPCSDETLSGTNIVATLPGLHRPHEYIVVCAHHDTIAGSPGADDNGSGLAALLELARLLGQYRWAASIQLVAFDLEESGMVGSRCYARALPRDQQTLLALVLESIGYASQAPNSQRLPEGFERLFSEPAAQLDARGRRGDFLALLAPERQRELLARVVAWMAQGAPDLPCFSLGVPLDTPLRDLLRSDHLPLWEEAIPAILLTDTAELRNPHYHLPSDHPGTLDPAFWRRVVAGVLVVVASMAEPVTG